MRRQREVLDIHFGDGVGLVKLKKIGEANLSDDTVGKALVNVEVPRGAEFNVVRCDVLLHRKMRKLDDLCSNVNASDDAP